MTEGPWLVCPGCNQLVPLAGIERVDGEAFVVCEHCGIRSEVAVGSEGGVETNGEPGGGNGLST
jgi:hypothetical protein